MSKLKDRIEEINKTVQKSRRINNILWIVVIIFVGTSIYFAIDAELSRQQAIEEKDKADLLVIKNDSLYQEALIAKNQLAINDSIKEIEIQQLLAASNLDLWDQTKKTNSLIAYSDYLDKTPDSLAQVNAALEEYFNKDGYVQLIETNGNSLIEVVSLSLEGKYAKFKTDRSVRDGAIGVDNAGDPSPKRIGVVFKGQIFKIEKEFPSKSSSSKSVWALIKYRQ
ncbi:MAG: hypothetical protein HKO75_11570 [Flavobacteriaceae bacterium]|nr:hypothetical protein [Muriicola sp.]MBT8289824.1 hypothetical protein [Muriicola sp.]NNC62153.1 hypothetical protein [Eudoraea sp.]NNK35018.1 hypothetical protein [Eudoraea sp.]NNL40490.1 hypothetical protein [Flavobacteriaceae bacterium]